LLAAGGGRKQRARTQSAYKAQATPRYVDAEGLRALTGLLLRRAALLSWRLQRSNLSPPLPSACRAAERVDAAAMGGAASASLGSIKDDAGAPPGEGDAAASRGARLYQYDAGSASWSVTRSSVDVTFVDNTEEEGDAAEWYVEVRCAAQRRRGCSEACAHARRARACRAPARAGGEPEGRSNTASPHAPPLPRRARRASLTHTHAHTLAQHAKNRWRTCLHASATT
jgi:hypothetical protein